MLFVWQYTGQLATEGDRQVGLGHCLQRNALLHAVKQHVQNSAHIISITNVCVTLAQHASKRSFQAQKLTEKDCKWT